MYWYYNGSTIILIVCKYVHTPQGSPKEYFNNRANLRNVMHSLCSTHVMVEKNHDIDLWINQSVDGGIS